MTELSIERGGAEPPPSPASQGATREELAFSRHLLEVAKAAAASVEAPLRAAFRSPMSHSYKRDLHDIVTQHDQAAEERIRAVILAAEPGSAIVGEEGGETGSGSLRWYVDPIDGTSNFARGIAHWCVSIAAAVDDRLVAGVILDPIARHLFCADLAEATLNGQPLVARAYDAERTATLVTSFPNARTLSALGDRALQAQAELTHAFLAVRNLGSAALNLAHVAAGWADATMGYQSHPWDVAAGALLVERAGGRFDGFRGGQPLSPAFLAPDYAASGIDAAYPTLDKVLRDLSAASAPSGLA